MSASLRGSVAINDIVFNALQAAPEGAGISRYTLGLAQALASLREDVVFAARRDMADRIGAPAQRILLYPDMASSWRRILAEQISLPRRARSARLIHHTDCMASLCCSAPQIITLHDLSFFRFPEAFTRGQSLWKRRMSRLSVRKAARVLCDSEHTARDAAEYVGLGQDKARVIYQGVALEPEAPSRPAVVKGDEPFILCVGSMEPRKNLVRLFEALALLKGQGERHRVVVAGGRGWKSAPVFEAVERLNLRADVVFTGHCADGELRWLYENALLLAYVSIYEGFGRPPVEAMTCGLPVVASNVSALPEACGAAARYVDPHSVEDMAQGIHDVASDEELRRRLAAEGGAQARRFQWRSAAEAVSLVYDELLG